MNHIREGEHQCSQPPLYIVAIRYAATLHAFWPRVLNVWEQPVGSSKAGNGNKKLIEEITPIPMSRLQSGALIWCCEGDISRPCRW